MVADMLGNREAFSYPKSLWTVLDSIEAITHHVEDAVVLDYFGGSGTTAHAVIELNRSDEQYRKYILVEMGDHFQNATKPRVQKAAYSKLWKNGKPVARDGISHCFKYLRLESYEDTLNNLSLRADPARDRALADHPALRQDYVLNYWLDVETQGSPSLLNVAAFKDPTAYQMRIKQPGTDVLRLQTIDLVETFNWLLGLWVTHLAAPQTFEAEFKREVDPELSADQNTRLLCTRAKPAADGPYWFRLVEGYTLKVPGDESTRQNTLVVWRKLTDDAEQDNAMLQHFLMEKLAISPNEKTFAVIYVNGSHTLPNPVVEGEKTKVRLIEEAFHQAMWSQDGA
jgi:adenine-specific DNA-methyltransferase